MYYTCSLYSFNSPKRPTNGKTPNKPKNIHTNEWQRHKNHITLLSNLSYVAHLFIESSGGTTKLRENLALRLAINTLGKLI